MLLQRGRGQNPTLAPARQARWMALPYAFAAPAWMVRSSRREPVSPSKLRLAREQGRSQRPVRVGNRRFSRPARRVLASPRLA